MLEQAGCQILLEPEQFALIDPCLPHEGRSSDASEVLTFTVGRRQLEARLGKVHDLTARLVAPDTAEGRLASAYLTMLPFHADGLGPAAQDLVEGHLLDLIALSLGRATERSVPRSCTAR